MAQRVKRYKGCCMLCTAWIRGQGEAYRRKASDLRRMGGRRRRVRRHVADE